MPLSLTIQNEHELHMVAKSDYRIQLSTFAPGVLVLLAMLLVGKFPLTLIFLPFIFINAYFLGFKPRERRCIINSEKQTVSFSRGGILNSSIDRFEEIFNTKVASIQMLRPIKRKGIYCSIGLLLRNHSQVIVLTDDDLSFRDCHLLSMQIQEFLGPEIPIVEVN
jgi:hypothetical protein